MAGTSPAMTKSDEVRSDARLTSHSAVFSIVGQICEAEEERHWHGIGIRPVVIGPSEVSGRIGIARIGGTVAEDAARTEIRCIRRRGRLRPRRGAGPSDSG